MCRSAEFSFFGFLMGTFVVTGGGRGAVARFISGGSAGEGRTRFIKRYARSRFACSFYESSDELCSIFVLFYKKETTRFKNRDLPIFA
jgi:hypothetical protein